MKLITDLFIFELSFFIKRAKLFYMAESPDSHVGVEIRSGRPWFAVCCASCLMILIVAALLVFAPALGSIRRWIGSIGISGHILKTD